MIEIPRPEELVRSIAEGAGIKAETVTDIFATNNISVLPLPPAQRALDIKRLRIKGTRVNTQWDGPFERTFDFGQGVTALITNENLRGKSTILELITWLLRGSPRQLRDDVKPWFELIQLEYSVNGTPMGVSITQGPTGFTADILRADTSDAVRSYLDGEQSDGVVHVLASGLSEDEFAAHQDQLMLRLLSMEPITNFQKYPGSDQGRPMVHGWPAYFGGIYLPKAASEILFGDTVFAALPARILQMFCNVPLMSTSIRLATLTKQVRQDEANRTRRLSEDATSRAGEKVDLQTKLNELDLKLAALVSPTSRTHGTVSAELRNAEQALAVAASQLRASETIMAEATSARQTEERRVNDDLESELAAILFHGLSPKHCPRCEQTIDHHRSNREVLDHQCAVCTQDVQHQLPAGTASADDDVLESEELEAEPDVLDALKQAEDTARQTLQAARGATQSAAESVDNLAAELNALSRTNEFNTSMSLRLEKARLEGRLEGLPDSGEDKPDQDPRLPILEASTEILNRITKDTAHEIFDHLNKEIVTLGRKFGIQNLESVELSRQGGMKVTTAGVETAFKKVTGGERLRLRVAVIIALLRVGNRMGAGSHPGLILLDSPGSDELTIDDETTLLRELDSLRTELPDLQVIVASAEPAAVVGVLPEGSIYSSLEGRPLW